jgi:hypothetical protein
MAKLRLEIEGDPHRVELESFVRASANFLKMLTEIDQVMTGRYRGTLRWYIADLSSGLNGLSVDVLSRLKPPPKSKPNLSTVDFSSRVAGSLVTGFEHVEKLGISPPYLSTYGLSNLNNMLGILGRNGARAYRTTDLEQGRTVELSQNAVETVRSLLPTKRKTIGSVEGQLEAISIHGNKKFVVYDSLTKKAISCEFDSEEMLSKVKDDLGKRVLVSGLVHWNVQSEPKRVEVENIRVLGDGLLPTTKDLSGAYPDITEGMTTEEYIRSIRGD